MRMNYGLPQGNVVSMNDIQESVNIFYTKFNVLPDTIKLSFKDFKDLLATMFHTGPQYLESGKKYGLFIPIPGGTVELKLLDVEGEIINNLPHGVTMFVVENTQIDKEFEKVVLGA